MFSRTTFLNKLEKATSHLQLEPDWNSIIAVSDYIRQGDVEPKFALNSIKKKLTGPNLHVNMFALLVLESCVKNCGPSFHSEIATVSFMEDLYLIVKGNTNEKIKAKVLELVQTWAHAFRSQSNYRPVVDMCNLLKLEGYTFPHLKESDAMFSANVAPEWVDGDCCNRCRVSFTLLERRHHCRCCGQVFCGKCSSKQSIIPKFGIEKEVRVCEDCYEKLNTTTPLKPKTDTTVKSKTTATTTTTTTTPAKSEEELREEEELQMAIALSRSEAEVKEKILKKYANDYQLNFENETNKTKQSDQTSHNEKEQIDPNLGLYMNRAYWEQKSKENSNKRQTNEAQPSAPQQTLVKKSDSNDQFKNSIKSTTAIIRNDSDDEDIEQFQNNLKSTIEIFVNRMNSNKNRGRPISNDSAVQSMFLNVTNMHSHLLKHIQKQDDLRSKFELLQDKLSQAKDARAALDSLREEHNEKLRREAEEAEMIKQRQMAYKLNLMRKKKQEYLQYQHQIALQRVQEKEREMRMRLEHQKYSSWSQHLYNQGSTSQFNPPDYSQCYVDQSQMYQNQYPNDNLAFQSHQAISNSISTNNIPNVHPTIQQPPPQTVPQSVPQSISQTIPQSVPQTVLPPQQPNPHIMPTSNPTALPYQPQPQYQGTVYNMQALNNSLPPQTDNAPVINNQQNPQSAPVTEKVEEPLISFD